jgi:hypothetical protein
VPFTPAFACGYKAHGASSDCLVPPVATTGYAVDGKLASDGSVADGSAVDMDNSLFKKSTLNLLEKAEATEGAALMERE